MKMKINALFLIAFITIATIVGCKSEKIYVIKNDNVVTNTVPLKSFNDENYVWENWTFGTNEVKNIYR